MPYTAEALEEKLKTALEASYIKLEDTSDGCGAKFNCVVVSSQFEGQPLLRRHRMVNGVLEEELKTIHAFSMKTLTPEQWQKQQEKS